MPIFLSQINEASIYKCYKYFTFLAMVSAGGLAALINVDLLRRKLNHVKSVHGVLDGMLFIDQPTKSGEHKMSKMLKDTFYLHQTHGNIIIYLFCCL